MAIYFGIGPESMMKHIVNPAIGLGMCFYLPNPNPEGNIKQTARKISACGQFVVYSYSGLEVTETLTEPHFYKLRFRGAHSNTGGNQTLKSNGFNEDFSVRQWSLFEPIEDLLYSLAL
jgi:hypothetical protein